MDRPGINLRVFLIIAGSAVVGAATAAAAYASTGSVHTAGNSSILRALVWTVFATPFATFWGWLLARHERGWQAAFWCFMIYFFSIFGAARIERLLQDPDLATRNGHDLYFKLTIGLNLLAALVAALREAYMKGTMHRTTANNSLPEEQTDGAGAA